MATDKERLERALALRRMLADRLGDDLSAFTRKAWCVLHPQRPLIWSEHYTYLCELLTLVRQRKLRRLIVNIPPRTLKSTLVTILFPVWTWITEPSHAFLAASYSLDLSTEHSVMRRSLLQSAWFQRLFGDRFQLSGERNQIGQFMNDKMGAMIATSVGASAMGRGCDTAILDDPMSADQALSDAERSSANTWINVTLQQRLNDPASSAIVLVAQRLHECDTTGFLTESEPGVWTHVKIPLVAEEDERWEFPISGRVWERKAGEVLMPSRFPPEVVEQLKTRRLVYAGQYQQRPAPLEGNLIKRSDVQYWGGVDPVTGKADPDLPRNKQGQAIFARRILSVDCSFKDLATSDYVAIVVIGIAGRKRYVLNVVNQRLDAAATEAEIRRQRAMYGPISAVLVEDKANGSSVIARLKANVPGVIAINPQGGKISRMYAMAPEWQARDWLVERNAAWCGPFIEQLLAFPNARFDDMCDSASQASAWLQANQPGEVVVHFWTGSGRSLTMGELAGMDQAAWELWRSG